MKLNPPNLVFSLLLFAWLSALTGAGQTATAAGANTPGSGASPSIQGPATNSATSAVSDLSSYVPDDKYKLRKGDRILFQIREDGDPARLMFVTDAGEINFPYVGLISVTDKSCKQVADLLKVELEKEYYYQATPILALDSANPILGRIYLMGQVRQPGPMDLHVNENLSVGKAILRAGGLAEFADRKTVKLMRATDANSQVRQTFELNMKDILDLGRSDKDMLVQPDDFIVVPSRLFNF